MTALALCSRLLSAMAAAIPQAARVKATALVGEPQIVCLGRMQVGEAVMGVARRFDKPYCSLLGQWWQHSLVA